MKAQALNFNQHLSPLAEVKDGVRAALHALVDLHWREAGHLGQPQLQAHQQRVSQVAARQAALH